MRITFFKDRLIQSGSVSNLLGLLPGLKAKGNQVHLITYGGIRTGAFKQKRISVKKIKKYYVTISFLSRFKRLINHVREFQPDLIQVESMSMLKGAYKISKMFDIPLIFMIHSFHNPSAFPSSGIMGDIKIVTVSQALREYLVNTIKLNKEKISVVHDGIELSEYSQFESPLEKGLISVGMCGSYLKERGYECFLDAVKRVSEKRDDVLFFISGYGRGESRIKKKARELNIFDSVIVINEFEDVRKVLSLYDIFVMPSIREGLGFRALEAMAMKKPVIASSVGGLMDVVRDNETGLLFNSADSEKLAENIEFFLDNPEQITIMGKKGREVIEKEFSCESMVSQMIEVYRSVLKQSKKRATTS